MATPTVAELIGRYVREIPVGTTHRAALERLSTYPVMGQRADKLRPSNIVDLARMRRLTVAPSTVAADISYLRSVLSYAYVGWDLESVNARSIDDAMPKLRQMRLIGHSRKRLRIPEPDEHASIIAWLQQRYEPRKVDCVDFLYHSARRRGEACRLQRGDLNADKKIILVRDMKHPRRKEGNNKHVALPEEALAILLRQPKLSDDPSERFFPYPPPSISAMHHVAVVALNIVDLHLHDYRAGVVTRLLTEGRSPAEIMLVTGHDSASMVLTIYNRMNAGDFHKRRINA